MTYQLIVQDPPEPSKEEDLPSKLSLTCNRLFYSYTCAFSRLMCNIVAINYSCRFCS